MPIDTNTRLLTIIGAVLDDPETKALRTFDVATEIMQRIISPIEDTVRACVEEWLHDNLGYGVAKEPGFRRACAVGIADRVMTQLGRVAIACADPEKDL